MSAKRELVVPAMRERLLTNRSGRLTANQWLDIVLQPLGAVLVLMIPFGVFMLPRLLLLLTRGWMFLLVLLAVIAATLVFRAFRYARAPVRFARLRAVTDAPPFWMFWRPLVMQDADGKEIRFTRRLAPRPIVQSDRSYIAYYLQDHKEHVLLSIAPADHPGSENWLPNQLFKTRAQRRGGE
jgi:hypothetical protein